MPNPTGVQDRIDRYWSERAQGYHDHQQRQFGNPEVRAAWEQVWREALPPPPARVLDLGTGTGHIAALLASLGHEVTGLDASAGMLDRARRNAAPLARPPVFRHGDAVDPDAPPGSLDAVTARYVLWTLRDAGLALRRWRRLLRPGGVLVAVDATWFPGGFDTERFRDAHGVGARLTACYDDEVVAALPLATSATIEDTAQLVREAGFVDVTVTPLHGLYALDERFGVADGHELTLQHRITGVNPGD